MVKLSNSVGNTGQNEMHDVAVIQAILKKAKRGKESKIRKPYWPGIIDGKYTSALCNALKEFQAEHGVPINGNCPSMGLMVNSLKKSVTNPYLKTLQAIPKTAVVYSSSHNSDQAKKEALEFFKPASMPTAEKASLVNLVNHMADKHNICAIPKGPALFKGAYMGIDIEIYGVSFIDNKTGVFLNQETLPPEALKKYINGQIGGLWQMGQGTDFSWKSSQPIKAFRGNSDYPDPDIFAKWGITYVHDEVTAVAVGEIYKIIHQRILQHKDVDREIYNSLLEIIGNGDNKVVNSIKKVTETCVGAHVNIHNAQNSKDQLFRDLESAQNGFKNEVSAKELSIKKRALEALVIGFEGLLTSLTEKPVKQVIPRINIAIKLNELVDEYHKGINHHVAHINQVSTILSTLKKYNLIIQENYIVLENHMFY